MDRKSFDIFFFGSVCSCLLTYLHVPHIVRVEKEKNALQFWGPFFQQVGTDCTVVPSNHVRLRRIRPFRHLSPQVLYLIHQMVVLLLLMMMMIHTLLDPIRRACTLWFMVHGSIPLY